ncbi:MAG TPA: PAS domain-containing protein, partial [Xanthobacteraceae bacterium]|nr:PAS domain-containing protein [Xanthobacteraceae bacterium]
MTALQDAAPPSDAVAAPPPGAMAGPQPGGRRMMSVVGRVVVCLALLSALTTFLVLVGFTPIDPNHYVVITLLGVNAVAVLLLVGIILRELWPIMQARRRGRAGARLHTWIVGLFSVIAAVPAILVAIVASITLDRGLDQFLSMRDLISNTLVIAKIYVGEQLSVFRGDTIAMAIQLTAAKPLFDQDKDRFRQYFTAQSSLRGMPIAMLIRADRSMVLKASYVSEAQTKLLIPPTAALDKVSDTEPHVEAVPQSNLLVSLIKVRGYDDVYLYTVRPLDPRVVKLGVEAGAALARYDALQARRVGVQIAFALMYAVIALTLLLSAVWIGLNFANLLVAPIRRLIGAANIVSTGNLYVQVPVRASEGDLAQLGETFNKMTQELRTQRDDLVRARDLIDSRRRFTEAVLAGASAGVIGVDAEGKISIVNRSAERLIGTSTEEAIGRTLTEVVPELAKVVASALTDAQRLVQDQVTINRAGRERIVSVRVATEQAADPQHGYVVTLDDITELVTAQRTSAWADVARRIAHEIKNPLTPIQLSAERLRKKYFEHSDDFDKIFDESTRIVINEVHDLKNLVDEFSNFARMPAPRPTLQKIDPILKEVIALYQSAHKDITIGAH